MPSIAVIGAGAAGLVASRHLIKCGLRPCIFESSPVVGGSWNAESSLAYKMWDNLSPNLSKYTCVFSDHLWPTSDNDGVAFPTQPELNQYLSDYSARYLSGQDYFRMGCTVTNIQRASTAAAGSSAFLQPFQVEWTDRKTGQVDCERFDGVIVATGFFAEPWVPACLVDRSLHSSRYRSPKEFADQTVAVCGASFSALEIAADVRKRAHRVISILPRIPLVLPRYVPVGTTGNYAPLDTVLYRRSQPAPQSHTTTATPEQNQKKHAFLRGLIGERKQLQSLGGFPDDTSLPPQVAISDDYLNLVADGAIETVQGRVVNAEAMDDHHKYSITLDNGQTIGGIDQIIACTGYRSNLSFLESAILETLQYDPSDGHAPLTLCNEAFHPEIAGLGFVGMYRGPYFGIMELQARLLAGMMGGQVTLSTDYIERALQASQIIRQKDNSVAPPPIRSQFPRFDYVGFMDQLAEPLGLLPKDEYGAVGAMVSPPFYTDDDDDDDAKCKWKHAIDQELQHGRSANMAQVALSALIGKWKFSRSISHLNAPAEPPQRVTGVIDFSQVPPTGKESCWNSVLYHEEGLFHLPHGKEMEVFRRYEYETKPNGILEIYFVEGGKRASLFLSLKFTRQHKNGYWIATSDHLCIKDLYKATFQIAFEGVSASHVTITYRVKGPNKDYESVTDLQPC